MPRLFEVGIASFYVADNQSDAENKFMEDFGHLFSDPDDARRWITIVNEVPDLLATEEQMVELGRDNA